MTFRQFAFNNVIRNKRLYAAYFLSSMFTVMVFFAFAIFAFHPVMTSDSLTSGIGQTCILWPAGRRRHYFCLLFFLCAVLDHVISSIEKKGIRRFNDSRDVDAPNSHDGIS